MFLSGLLCTSTRGSLSEGSGALVSLLGLANAVSLELSLTSLVHFVNNGAELLNSLVPRSGTLTPSVSVAILD